MCYVCNCFGWILDLIQRALTFLLTCWMTCAVCCGLAIAITAGIAYGYNYSLAEWITLTRSDVRVYMRRGQFYDRPDLILPKRRSGDEEDAFPYNLTEDYPQEVPAGENSLAKDWEKRQDLKHYAEKLAKYSDSQNTFLDAGEPVQLPETSVYYKFTTPPSRRVSIIANPVVPTAVLRSGTSEIVMRMFHPVPEIIASSTDGNQEYEELLNKFNISDIATTPLEERERKTRPMSTDFKIRPEESPQRKTLNMRHWGKTLKPIILDYTADADEDDIVYKAV